MFYVAKAKASATNVLCSESQGVSYNVDKNLVNSLFKRFFTVCCGKI